MSEPTFDTTMLNGVMDRIRLGDAEARDELFRAVGRRLERLARKMLGGSPAVRRLEDTTDIVQEASIRLYRALEKMEIDSTRAFFGLAAQQIRRTLIDLWRRHYGPQGFGANHESIRMEADRSEAQRREPAAPSDAEDEFENWIGFHEAVEQLPAEEREVIGLHFYHGWKQEEIAELFGTTVRTVQRRWQRAIARLREQLNDECV